VREGVNTGNRKTKIRAELIGDAEGISLDANPEQLSVAIVAKSSPENMQCLDLFERHVDTAEFLGLDTR